MRVNVRYPGAWRKPAPLSKKPHGAPVEALESERAGLSPSEKTGPPSLTVASLVFDKKQYVEHLEKALSYQHVAFEEIIEDNQDNHTTLGKFYADVIDRAKCDIIVFSHPDIEFSPHFFSLVLKLAKDSKWGAIGVVGRSYFSYIWSHKISVPTIVSTLDSCVLVIDRRHKIKFDVERFDGFHCVVEDYCLQARADGRSVLVAAPVLATHFSATILGAKAAAWHKDYKRYRDILIKKWPGINRSYWLTAG